MLLDEKYTLKALKGIMEIWSVWCSQGEHISITISEDTGFYTSGHKTLFKDYFMNTDSQHCLLGILDICTSHGDLCC